jgi:hypothetical protein
MAGKVFAERYKMMNKIIPFLLLAAVTLLAQNYPSYPIGQYWSFPDARALSLAGAGSVSLAAPGAILYNPAALSQINSPLSLDLTIFSRKLEERRSYPLYDRFDSYLVNSTYALNNNWYSWPQGAAAVKLPFLGIPSLTLAAGIFSEIDYRYSYLEEVRENIFGDPLIAYNQIQANGVIKRYSTGLAMDIPTFPRLAVGLQAGFLNGSSDYQVEVDYLNHDEQLIFRDENRKLTNTPLIFSAGSIYQLSERISIGVDFSLPYTLKYDVTLADKGIVQESIGYPFRVNAGFEYRSRQELQARLNADIGYEFWSNRDYNQQTDGAVVTLSEFSDVFYFKTGIEHVFFNQIPFRVGAQYRNSYIRRGISQTLLAAGSGFFNQQWRVDVAGALSKLSYRWEDLFDDKLYMDDPNFQSRSELDTVDETYFFLQISFKYFINF